MPAFPTLKRGANKRCAYGAGVQTMVQVGLVRFEWVENRRLAWRKLRGPGAGFVG